MKKLFALALLVLLFILFCSYAKAQNGGQYFENNVIRIDYLGCSNGQHVFKICNKQNCEARIRTRVEIDPATDIIVGALQCETLSIPTPTNTNILFRVKAETSCIPTPDMGWLEINTSLLTLPIIETNYISMQRGPNKLEILIRNGLYKSSFTNLKYIETIRIYNISGTRVYEKRSIVEKNHYLYLTPYLDPGINLIEVLIETDRPDRFLFKYFKQQN